MVLWNHGQLSGCRGRDWGMGAFTRKVDPERACGRIDGVWALGWGEGA